jgi:hypothetical protein
MAFEGLPVEMLCHITLKLADLRTCQTLCAAWPRLARELAHSGLRLDVGSLTLPFCVCGQASKEDQGVRRVDAAAVRSWASGQVVPMYAHPKHVQTLFGAPNRRLLAGAWLTRAAELCAKRWDRHTDCRYLYHALIEQGRHPLAEVPDADCSDEELVFVQGLLRDQHLGCQKAGAMREFAGMVRAVGETVAELLGLRAGANEAAELLGLQAGVHGAQEPQCAVM